MAIVQKVIILNKPFKLFGFTLPQGVLLVGSGLLGLMVGSNLPQIKIAGAPLIFWVTFISFCSALIFISASQMKPWAWWRNRILSIAGLTPNEILPKTQAAKTYLVEEKADSAETAAKFPPKGKSLVPGFSRRK